MGMAVASPMNDVVDGAAIQLSPNRGLSLCRSLDPYEPKDVAGLPEVGGERST